MTKDPLIEVGQVEKVYIQNDCITLVFKNIEQAKRSGLSYTVFVHARNNEPAPDGMELSLPESCTAQIPVPITYQPQQEQRHESSECHIVAGFCTTHQERV